MFILQVLETTPVQRLWQVSEQNPEEEELWVDPVSALLLATVFDLFRAAALGSLLDVNAQQAEGLLDALPDSVVVVLH